MQSSNRAVILAAALILCIALATAAVTAAGKATTVKGELVCLTCYMSHDGRGPSHAACAKTCTAKGLPMGLLAGSKLYVLLEDHSNASAYKQAIKLVGSNVSLSGGAISKGGVQGLSVAKVSKA